MVQGVEVLGYLGAPKLKRIPSAKSYAFICQGWGQKIQGEQASSLTTGTLKFPAIFFHLFPFSPLAYRSKARNILNRCWKVKFHALFFHLLPLFLINTYRESKHHLSPWEPFDFRPCSSIASLFLFYQASQEIDETFINLLETCSSHSFLFLGEARSSLSHAKLMNAQLPCYKLLMPSHNIYL